MGNTRSSTFEQSEDNDDLWWQNKTVTSDQCVKEKQEKMERNISEDTEEIETTPRQKTVKEELDEFTLELARKREKRRQILDQKHQEMKELRVEVRRLKMENEALKNGGRKIENGAFFELERLRKENEELRDSVEKTASDLAAVEELRRRNLELKMTVAETQNELLGLSAEIESFEKERVDYKNHVAALKDVVAVSKQMLMIRENQLKELKQKVNEIEASLAEKDLTALSQDLQKEYEKQLQNMKNLRIFYEERLRAHVKEKGEMKAVIDEVKRDLEDERKHNGELKETIERLEEENSKKYDEVKNLESNLGLTKAECRQYQAELTVINQLFSQILLGFNNNQEVDIDKLIKLLEQNHHLLQDIAINEESNQVSALPKVLLDLVSEASDKKEQLENETEDTDEEMEEGEAKHLKDVEPQLHQMNSASEIVENLPKVWRVLIELLSHQCAPVIVKEEENENPCYKVVDTPKGPLPTLSVSKTFIRLKDLILEKKSLERETNRLKHLNTHLETRLQEQEKRLETVSTELSETWHVVGKLQKKHQLLHTQEKILRYELAQKRKLLNELKEELEYSREKWQEAREKNSNTEKQWEQLRAEFALRKSGPGDDYNNSVESGYSDEKECSSEDEPGYETDVSECNQKSEDQPDDSERTVGLGSEAIVECNQKVLSSHGQPEDSERAEEMVEGAETIVDVIQEEIAAIEDLPSKTDPLGDDSEEKTLDATSPIEDSRITLEDLEEILRGARAGPSRFEDSPESGLECSRICPEDSGPCLEDSGAPSGDSGESDTRLSPSRSVGKALEDSEQTLDDTRQTLEMSGKALDESRKTLEKVLSAREERLQRLEGQASSLVKQVASTSNRSVVICNKLDALHGVFSDGRTEDGGSGSDETSAPSGSSQGEGDN